MPQVEILDLAREHVLIRQSGAVIRGGEAGDRQRRIHGIPNRLRREIRCAGVPALLADVDGDADALVTVVLDSLDFAAAHRDRLAETFAHLGLRRTRTLRLGAIQDVFCDLEASRRCRKNGYQASASRLRYRDGPKRNGEHIIAVKMTEFGAPINEKDNRMEFVLIKSAFPMPPTRRWIPDSVKFNFMARETPISKSRRKKEMLELQELGVELIALSVDQLAAIELPELLRDAVLEARRITDFEAGAGRPIRRQAHA